MSNGRTRGGLLVWVAGRLLGAYYQIERLIFCAREWALRKLRSDAMPADSSMMTVIIVSSSPPSVALGADSFELNK